jgi:hypothetical protein
MPIRVQNLSGGEMYNDHWIEDSNRRDHQKVMDKLDQIAKISSAFANSPELLTLSIDFHADRYGDVKLKISANRRADQLRKDLGVHRLAELSHG